MRAERWEAPSDLRQAGVVAYYELYKYFQSYRILGMFVLSALVIALILIVPPALGQEYPREPAFYAQRYLLWVSVLTVVGATLFAGDALASEFQNRTAYLMFPNPVKRWAYFAGKLAASVITLAVVITVYYVVVSILTIFQTDGFSDLTFQSYGISLMYVVAAVGVGYLVSSIMKGSTEALVFTLAILLLVFPIIDGVLAVAGVKPTFSVTFNAMAIGDVMQDPYPQDQLFTFPVGGGFFGGGGGGLETFSVWDYHPDLELVPVVMAAYAVVTIAMALVLFRRREMAA